MTDKPIAYEESTVARLKAEGWNGDVSGLRSLATLGESLRRRYENECSYPWANTESYEKRTREAEERIRSSAKAEGLTLYLQGDCRGATVYVCGPAGNMTAQNYSTLGQCLYRK